MADQRTPTPAEIVIMASGAVALVGSFLDFTGFEDFGSSAWSSGSFPVVTLMAIFAVISGVVVALRRFAGVALPGQWLGFSWPQIHLVLGFFAALYALAFLVLDTAADKKIGFWLILIGCVGSLVGAIMLTKEPTAAAGPGPGRPAPPVA